jgi:hypothetical protein
MSSNPTGGMDVCLLYSVCVLSGRGLCDGPIPRPEESYRLWCVSECDQVQIKTLDTYCEQVGRREKDYETKRNFLWYGWSLHVRYVWCVYVCVCVCVCIYIYMYMYSRASAFVINWTSSRTSESLCNGTHTNTHTHTVCFRERMERQ